MTPPATKWQLWMQARSAGLKASFLASKAFSHNVTKGESREHQVLDVLESLLPQRISVGRNVLVIDADDTESPKFDGVLVDRDHFPILYAANDLMVAMIESVVACIEIKSMLNAQELQRIFRSVTRLRAMKRPVYPHSLAIPPITAFSYECANVNLAFLDYSTAFWRRRETAPTTICVLDTAVFAAMDPGETDSLFPPAPSAVSVPAFLDTGIDTLLVYSTCLVHRSRPNPRWPSPSTPTVAPC